MTVSTLVSVSMALSSHCHFEITADDPKELQVSVFMALSSRCHLPRESGADRNRRTSQFSWH